jgi:hypothetical protein
MLKSDGITWDPTSNRPKPNSDLWLGPFQIIGPGEHPNNFELSLPPSMSRLHPIFHTKLLKPYTDPSEFPNRQTDARPDPVVIGGETFYEVEKILDTKIIHNKRQFLIKFLGFPDSENEWLPASTRAANPTEFAREQAFLKQLPTQVTSITSSYIDSLYDTDLNTQPSQYQHSSGGIVMDMPPLSRDNNKQVLDKQTSVLV